MKRFRVWAVAAALSAGLLTSLGGLPAAAAGAGALAPAAAAAKPTSVAQAAPDVVSPGSTCRHTAVPSAGGPAWLVSHWQSNECARHLQQGFVRGNTAVVHTDAYTAALMSADQARAHRSCSIGGTKYKNYYGPPGKGSVWFTSSSSPSGCEQYRMTIQSVMIPSQRYHSGWIRYDNGKVSTASTCMDSSDCSKLANAWEDRRPYNSSTYQCRDVIGIPTKWKTCTVD